MKKTLIIIATATAILSTSCGKDFGDMNVSPTKLTTASTKALLTNSLQAMSSLTLGNTAASRLPALYMQHLSEGPYPGPSLYSDRTLTFSTWYTGPLYNLQTIINYNMEGNAAATGNGHKDNQIAVAKILMSYYYLVMTDIWGEIPYSEALQGGGDYQPAYDKQQDIYTGIFKTLTDASALIKESEAKVVGDVMLNGDMAAWKRFSNTMRMTMALRLSKVDPAKGKIEYAAAETAGVITSNAQNIAYKFLAGDPNNYNPWYTNYLTRNDYAISKTMTDYMAPKADPRLPVYAEVLAGNIITGLPYGKSTAVNIPNAFSRIGGKFGGFGVAAATAQAAPIPLFNYAQVLFMKAEAAKIGYISGSGDAEAAVFYKDAIKASWEQYGVFAQGAFDTYMALPAVAYASATGLRQIMTEKWVHMYLNSFETWNDWRRTGFPVLIPAVDAVDPRGIPFRLGYTTTEASLNGENYAASVARQGVDDNYTKIWWAK